MKKILLSLVMMFFTSICFAQDVIVQKDGSTILAKVMKVTNTEVEYKKFSNQNGPSYTISVLELKCINYENGEKDSFVSLEGNSNSMSNNMSVSEVNGQTPIEIYNQSLRKKAKTLKLCGWIVGGTLFCAGVTSSVCGLVFDINEVSPLAMAGFGMTAVGVGTWAGLYFSGRRIERKINSPYTVQNSPIYQHEMHVGKYDRLTVGIDMIKDNSLKNQTLGLGLSYNF